jgi:hypothetical protein
MYKYHLIPDIRPYCKENIESPVDDNPFVIPSVAPGWDHTPRTGKEGRVLIGSTPEKFEEIVQTGEALTWADEHRIGVAQGVDPEILK